MPKTALVTGGSRGIGRAICEGLARDGFVVAVNYAANRAAADETVASIEAAGGEAYALQCDLTQPDAIAAMFAAFDAEAEARIGDRRLDVLVNNAGMTMVGGISEVTPQAYDAHFDLNMKGAFFTTQAALQRMPGPGRIINISSVAARSARPHVIAYAATKGAMNSFTLALAVEVAPRQITVNAVAPGFVKTDLSEKLLTPERMREAVSRVALGRIGAPPDIAAIVSFLASDASGWVTGQVIDASGGTSLS